MDVINLKSPAKLNLYLRVINKRQDGYHNIETIFERINLCDEIELKKRQDSKIIVSCDYPNVPCDRSNLAYKAAKILKKDFPDVSGIDIIIRKNIPVAAGLGGGSSNAASVLLGLNRLWQLKLGERRLLNYASKIGSDVSFFIKEKSFALGTGRGDGIRILPNIRTFWHILIVPQLKIYSKDIYRGLNLKLTRPKVNVNMLIYALRNSNFNLLQKYIFNVLEHRVLRKYPGIFNIKKELKSLGVKINSLSGSGCAVFGLISSRKEGELIRNKLKTHKRWKVFVVRTF